MNTCSYIAAEESRHASADGGVSPGDARRLADIFAALGEPTRLRILDALDRAGELCVCDLCAQLDLGQSNVSHQLRLLRNLRLVTFRKQGRTVYYKLGDDHVATLLRQTLDHLLEDDTRSPYDHSTAAGGGS